MNVIFARLFLNVKSNQQHQMMQDHYKKYGELFQVDSDHFKEFYALLHDTVLLKSDFFSEAGRKMQISGLYQKRNHQVFLYQ